MRHDDSGLDWLNEPKCECGHSLWSHTLTGTEHRGRCLAPRRGGLGCGCGAYRPVAVASTLAGDTPEVDDAQTR
jgi:hypothetical protein